MRGCFPESPLSCQMAPVSLGYLVHRPVESGRRWRRCRAKLAQVREYRPQRFDRAGTPVTSSAMPTDKPVHLTRAQLLRAEALVGEPPAKMYQQLQLIVGATRPIALSRQLAGEARRERRKWPANPRRIDQHDVLPSLGKEESLRPYQSGYADLVLAITALAAHLHADIGIFRTSAYCAVCRHRHTAHLLRDATYAIECGDAAFS